MEQTTTSRSKRWNEAWRFATLVTAGSLLTLPLTGCLVAGYSSGSGFFIWPGSLVFLVILALLYFFLRGR